MTWGATLACHAAVTSKEGIYAVRFFLGLVRHPIKTEGGSAADTLQCEAGMFPGVILQLAYWYRADEMTLRLWYFYILGNFSSVIGGVLAFAFDTMSGRCGLSGWQWLFLVEGVITIAFGVVIWFVLPDFPLQAKWLNDKEKAFVQARLPANAPRASEADFKWTEIIKACKDSEWLRTVCVFRGKLLGY